nr:hypothetical protein [Tanacetum cinerariifolium]
RYLQHEHYALWEIIEFGDSYKAPPEETAKDKGLAGRVSSSIKKKGRTVAITAEDMQKRKNDVKARTTLLLALPDEHHRKSKVPTIQGASTASAQVPTVSTDVAAASLSYDIRVQILKESRQREEKELQDPKEDDTSKNHALVADEEEVPTEYALMAKSSSSLDNKVYDDSFCSKSCRKNTENLNTKTSKLNEELSDGEVLEGDIELKDNKIEYLKNELEEVKKEKESIDFKIENFKNASKDLDRLLGSQKLDKDMMGIGFNEYCVIPPPPAQVYSPPKKDLSWMGLSEFVDDTVTNYTRPTTSIDVSKSGIPQDNIDDKGYWDNGCSRHMTRNISYLSEYEPFNEGYVSFGHGRGKITGKGSIKTDFKLVDDKHVLIRTPRQQNMYTIDLKNVVSHKNLTCLIAKALVDERMLWYRRLGHLNFKTINKLVRSNLVKGLHFKSFANDHSCVSCLKEKQHKASFKSNLVNPVSKPLHTLHMYLFRPTSVSSLNQKWYCLVVTDDFSRSDNGGEFRNKEMDELCSRKSIKREFSNARTPQQNGVAERRNRTLIEAVRTMFADAKLPVTFWAEVVNTACYVQNRVLVIKPHNMTPYELFNKRSPTIGFLRPFGKAFRVFNKRTKKIKENLHVDFLENKSIEKGTGPDWLFDIDTLTNFMNYVPVVVTGTSSTNISGTKEDVHQAVKEKESLLRFIVLPNWFHEAQMASSNAAASNDDAIPVNNAPQQEQPEVNGDKDVPESSGNSNLTASTKVSTNDSFELASSSTVETEVPTVSTHVPTDSLFAPLVTSSVPIIISREGSSFPEPLFLGNAMSFENRLDDFFGDTSNAVSLNEVEADLSNMETAIQEEGINYEEVFALVARIEAIRLFLAYASYMGFVVYQMNVKSAFQYRTIDEEVYVMQPLGFQDHKLPWIGRILGEQRTLQMGRELLYGCGRVVTQGTLQMGKTGIEWRNYLDDQFMDDLEFHPIILIDMPMLTLKPIKESKVSTIPQPQSNMQTVNLLRTESQTKVGGTFVCVCGAIFMVMFRGSVIFGYSENDLSLHNEISAMGQLEPAGWELHVHGSLSSYSGNIACALNYRLLTWLNKILGRALVALYNPLEPAASAFLFRLFLGSPIYMGRRIVDHIGALSGHLGNLSRKATGRSPFSVIRATIDKSHSLSDSNLIT